MHHWKIKLVHLHEMVRSTIFFELVSTNFDHLNIIPNFSKQFDPINFPILSINYGTGNTDFVLKCLFLTI